MFNRIVVHYDTAGNRLEEPTVLKCSDIRSKSIYIETDSYRCIKDGTFPALHITRSWIDTDNDPWNEDGRPPCVLFIMVMPHVNFYSRSIEIIGFEVPNLIWAGLPRPAYDNCKPLDDKLKTWPLKSPTNKPKSWDLKDKPYEFSSLKMQKVVLIS